MKATFSYTIENHVRGKRKMGITCGTDIIEIERIKQSIEKLGNSFLNRIYTDREIQYCESKKKQKYQHYAARFAAKEAVFKAISKGLEDKYKINWKDIEIVNNSQGRPAVFMNGTEQKNIDISISHCKEYAVATVVMFTTKQ